MQDFVLVVLIASFFASCAKGTSGTDSEDVTSNTGGKGAGGSHGSTSGAAGGGDACQADTFEPNGGCSVASKVGVVSDANDNALSIVGTLTDASDEDWYNFDSIDTDEKVGNSYHVSISFTSPGEEFVFDVVRAGACEAADTAHSNLTSYTWCVDGSAGSPDAGAIGEANCSKTDGGTSGCIDHTSPYFIRVHQNPEYTAAGSCASYTITVSGRGGEPCDFTQKCDPQTTL